MKAKKSWEQYSSEEKEQLLKHWFYYYGGILMTPEDLNNFIKLLPSNEDEIFDHIITNYIINNTIQSNMLVVYMINGKLDELFKHSIKKEMIKPERKEKFEEIRREIAKELVTTLNNPEPPVPMELTVVNNTSRKNRSS